MEEKIIVIKPDDTIELADYDGYKSLKKTVNGLIERFDSFALPIDPTLIGKKAVTKLSVSLYCNEEFLISDSKEFDKINAVASLISNQEIRGNVAMVVLCTDDGENRGFEYESFKDENGTALDAPCECLAAYGSVMEFIHLNECRLENLHEQLDNKSVPYIKVYGFDVKPNESKKPVERE